MEGRAGSARHTAGSPHFAGTTCEAGGYGTCGGEKKGAALPARTSVATPVYSRVQSLPSSQPERLDTPGEAGRSQGSCDSGSSGPAVSSVARRRRQPAGTGKAYASPSGKHESIAAWRYDPFGGSHRDEGDVAREARRVREGLSAAGLVRRDAPGVLWEQSVALHGGPPLRLGDVSLGRGSTPVLRGRGTCGGAGGRTDSGASDFCQRCGPAT